MVRSIGLADCRISVYGADVLAYYETSNNLLLFLLVSLQKYLGLKFETQKRPGSPWYFKSLILVYPVRPERRPKGDLIATSATSSNN